MGDNSVKRVVVDAFGGDHAPQAVVEGCVMALEEFADLFIILTGDEEKIRQELSKHSYDAARIEIRHAPDIIANSEHPVQAVRTKKNSSLVKALEVVAAKEADVLPSKAIRAEIKTTLTNRIENTFFIFLPLLFCT